MHDVAFRVELHLQDVHRLGPRHGEVPVHPEEVDAVAIGEGQTGPAAPLPDVVGQRDGPSIDDLHIHGASGNNQLQAQRNTTSATGHVAGATARLWSPPATHSTSRRFEGNT